MTNPLLARTFLMKFMHRTDMATDEVLARYQMPSTLRTSTSDLGYWLVGFLEGNDVGMSSDAAAFTTLPMPVAIVWGREDTTTPLSQGEQLHALIASSTLTIIDGVGHMPHLEDPAAFDAVVKNILTGWQ
jgi:pimeloyl-ACP methyl ester carboxylesterase